MNLPIVNIRVPSGDNLHHEVLYQESGSFLRHQPRLIVRFDLEREPLPRKPDRNQLTAAIALNVNDLGFWSNAEFSGTSFAGTVMEPLLAANALAVSSIAKPVIAPVTLHVLITKTHFSWNSGCITRARRLQIKTHPGCSYSRTQVISSSI
jgi:hypothetical protein